MDSTKLFLAILLETVSTISLKYSQGFTKPLPTTITLAGYATAFYLLSQVLLKMSVGTVYAIWCGVGMAFIALMGTVLFGEKLDTAAWFGILLILVGVICITMLSNSHYTG